MRRVLVIDDHDPSRMHLVKSLQRCGYEIAGEGSSGKLAPALARAAAPDVILMAVGLADVDGIEAARDILWASPMPIILLTSHYDSATVERAKQVVAGLVKHGAFKAMRQQLRKIAQAPANGTKADCNTEPAKPVIRAEEIQEGAAKLVRVKGEETAIFKSGGQLYGVQNNCPHEGGQLCKGWVEAGEVVCPLHGYKFDLKNGACSTDPNLKVKVFKLVSRGDEISVEE